MLTCSWGGADSESLSLFFFFFLFINIHIQECAHFSAAERDKGKGFNDEILCVSVNFMLVKLD